MTKFKKHIPFHLYLDNQIYFITARTYEKVKYFNSNNKLRMLSECINESAEKYKIEVYAYVILYNHYHLSVKMDKGNKISDFIKYIHGKSGRLAKKWNTNPRRIGIKRIWWNYWDSCIRNEATFYKRINYIHHNPLKHGYVKKMEDYKYSSYNIYIKKYGSEFVNDMFAQYPITDFSDPNDDF